MIRDALLLQKRELEKKLGERYIERNVDIKKFDNDVIKVIMGPRRAGKSFFAIHTMKKMGSFGYANFDDEQLVGVENYNEIVDEINALYDNPEYLLLDEIQNLDKWELFVNRLQRQGYNLVITGSNSKLLSRELSTHLTGRHLRVNIFPFPFSKFLEQEKEELTDSEIKTKMASYIQYGGYPEPLVKNLNYKEYLSTLFDSIIYKDIVKRHRIRLVEGLEDLALYLLSNAAEEFSYNALSKVTKCKSVHTVEKYLKYLEEAFLFFKVKKFSFKVKEQAVENKKIYCTDNGLIYTKAFKFSPDVGKLYENAVAIKLKEMELNGGAEVYFWKNQQQEEVDFVLKKGTKIRKLIQVCADIKNAKVKKRETRALLKSSRELKCSNLMIITGRKEGTERVKGRTISYIPLWKFLLS